MCIRDRGRGLQAKGCCPGSFGGGEARTSVVSVSPRRRGQSSSTQPSGRATITGNRRPSPRLVTGASKGQEQADRLAPGHTRGRVRGHGKTLPRDRGARGSEVPLLRGNQRRHPARTHLSRSWSASEPASTTSPRNLRHFEAARNSTPSRERRTVHWGKEPEDLSLIHI